MTSPTTPVPLPSPSAGDVWSIESYETGGGAERYRVLEHRKDKTLRLAVGFKTEEAARQWLADWNARAIIGGHHG